MAKLKFKNPKTGLWEEAGGTTYTAGEGISISDNNVISGDFSGLFESKEIIASAPVAPYNDCNTIPINTCVSYAIYVNSSVLANKPSSFNNGTIMTLGPKAGTSIVTQIAVNGSNIMWHRAKYGSTWTEWVQEMTDSSVHSRSYTTISMFDKVGVVGDSFASGATYGVNGINDGEHYGIAWGRILSKRNNISVNIFAASGLSTKTWLEDNNGLAALQAKDPQDLYLLCLGINDNKTGADPIGTVDDIHDNDYTQNPSTFFGNYGRIVAQIKIHAPTSKLIFIVPKGYKANNIGIAISQIAEHYSVPCIRFDDDPFFSSTFYQNNLHTGHPVGITYAGMATAIERLYSKCAIDNPTYFIDYISKYSYTYNNEGNVSATGDNNLTGSNTFSGTVTVPTPTADNEAAAKKYVDDHAGGGGDVTAARNNTFTGTNTFKNESNFEGKVNIEDSITLFPKNVDTEEFLTISVDANEGRIAAVHTATGGIVSKDISFVGSTLKELGAPVNNTDAANKKYVDDKVSALNIKNGTGARSLLMNNDNTVTEPDDANTGIPVYSEGIPQANGIGSFAIGAGTKAEGHASTAEGINTKAGYERDDKSRNVGSHAEGINTYAKSSGSHAEGFYTESLASNSHTEGFKTTVNSDGWSGHAEGRQTVVNGKAGHAEGYLTQTNGTEAHAEGMSTKAEGDRAHAEGENTIAGVKVGDTFNEITVTDDNRINYRAAHAEGIETKAYMKGSHAEGSNTTASGNYSHAEGDRTNATGSAGHAEGCLTTAGYRSHAEGEQTIAGGNTTASKAAHAEGISTQATGGGSHAEGKNTVATGQFAHAEGNLTTASGQASHAGGEGTSAEWKNSTVIGQYNKTTNLSYTGSNPLFIVGNGTSTSSRSNAFEIYADGTAYVNDKKVLVEGNANFLKLIAGYDASKVQILSHDANGNLAWINSIDTLLI